jgi:hypothetical protein
MNGVHDMGGMHGMGPIVEGKNEPVFHQEWEGRIFAMNRATGAWRKWNLDASRHSKEVIPPAEYLRMSYYERWVAGLVELIVQSGLTTRAEIESGAPAPGSVKAIPALTADKAVALVEKGVPERECGCTVPNGPASARPEHASSGAHKAAAICSRKIRHDRPGSWRLRLSGHQRPFPRRKAPARLLRALRRSRTVGRTSSAKRFRLSRHVG